MIKVVLADDESMVRDGFRLILETQEDLVVAGEASDGFEAVRLAKDERPDVILMDIRMPKLDGLAATREIVALGQATRVLVLTTFDSDEYVYEALKSGAGGFMLKSAPRQDLIAAVRVVARGEELLAPTITRRLIETYVRQPRPGTRPHALDELSERELDVLRLTAKGRSNTEIARELFIGESTVKTHIGRIFRKLGLRDRAQAVVIAYESGLIHVGDEEAAQHPFDRDTRF